MKRCFALLLATLLLLSGCGTDSGSAQPEPTLPPTEPTQPPKMIVYQHTHSVEILTHGAVRRYGIQGEGYYGLLPLDEGLLLLSGEEQTTLTYVPEAAEQVSSAVFDSHLSQDTLWHTALGLSYYDPQSHNLVFLDDTLTESSRISLPKEMADHPVLSADGQLVYYYDAQELRCLELRSGISRLLKESRFEKQQVQKLHFEDTVLECRVSDSGGEQTLFISTQTGETIFQTQSPVELQSRDQEYFARWREGEQELLLFGTRGQTIQRLTPQAEGIYQPLFGADFLVSYETDSTGMSMICYDQASGNRLARVRLAGLGAPLGMAARDGEIWFLARSLFTAEEALYCWTPSCEEMENSFLSPYYTAQSPDHEGLERCERQATTLAQTYGVKIELWKDAASPLPKDYSVTPEYLVSVYEKYLPVLEQALSTIPKTVYQKLGKQSQNGKLTISLVRESYGTNELGSLTLEEGAHFWSNGSSYLLLMMNENLERSFYHELFHAMDSYILTESKAYDDWRKLNPAGFAYDYSYITNEYRDPKDYLEPETRAFIDLYSMSYPKEDRARIMEYAMMEGNEAYFTSATMAKKLDTLCKGIRKAFKLDSGDYLWEQYL
jgi:hypothetical protein